MLVRPHRRLVCWGLIGPISIKQKRARTELLYSSFYDLNGDQQLQHFGSASRSFHANGFPVARVGLSSNGFDIPLRWITECM